TLLKFFFGQMLDQLREDGAARVHPSLFHPEDRRKEVNPALFQFKSFLRRSCVIMLIFNGLEWPPEILAGQQCFRIYPIPGVSGAGSIHHYDDDAESTATTSTNAEHDYHDDTTTGRPGP